MQVGNYFQIKFVHVFPHQVICRTTAYLRSIIRVEVSITWSTSTLACSDSHVPTTDIASKDRDEPVAKVNSTFRGMESAEHQRKSHVFMNSQP